MGLDEALRVVSAESVSEVRFLTVTTSYEDKQKTDA